MKANIPTLEKILGANLAVVSKVMEVEKWKQDFEAELLEQLEIYRDIFRRNPHDQYMGYSQGCIDILEKILGLEGRLLK